MHKNSLHTPVQPRLCARPVAKFIVVYGIPVGVFHAGNNLSAKSFALSRNMPSPERSYALRRPPSTLYQKQIKNKQSCDYYEIWNTNLKILA